ncbi:MAG: GDSL family lipase [Clostridia bacterium]|nr:GDSL family lipase [Clostridia bacterium]
MRLVFFGDSVTEGCFELFDNHCGGFDTVKDIPSGYSALTEKRLKEIFPDTEIEVINAGIAGNSSGDGLARLDADVIEKKPDIAVVCFGLNDVGQRKPDNYRNNLSEIFKRLKNAGSEVIFMTPNMVNTYVHPMNLTILQKTAMSCAECQNDGTMDLFMDTARECAEQNGAEVCDVYAIWKKMKEYGIDTTELLCNYINHPTRQMHRLFADALEPCLTSKIKKMLSEKAD